MSYFRRALAERLEAAAGKGKPKARRWVFVAYDQLNDQIGPLAVTPASEIGIVLVESREKSRRRPYHRQKLALVLANLRHFALEQAARGVAVRHVFVEGGYRQALEPLLAELGPIAAMEPAERELRVELEPLLDKGLRYLPHDGWLTSRTQFLQSQKTAPPYRMDSFYRRVRRDSRLLMEAGKPAGGKWSHDADNRLPWNGEPAAAEPPAARLDEVTREVMALVNRQYADHPGMLEPHYLYAQRDDIDRLWRFVKERALPHFGPFEDAMSTASRTVFHSRLSGLLNLQRLLPKQLVTEVAALEGPLSSREGFIRQILGWREFMRHVHRETDGFRRVKQTSQPSSPLPPAYWGKPSGLHCLDQVVGSVWQEGYSHHITRLMVLGNLATLLEASPRELTDWFWVAYEDAYDWVVESNVLGMGSFSYGPLLVTKPYISGAAYIDRMSNYCEGCAFDPRRNCPIAHLYWAYLGRHQAELKSLPRMAMPLVTLRRRPAAQQHADAAVFEEVTATLARGEVLVPKS